MENFKEYALYYDAFYGDKDYCAEAKDINALIESNSKNLRVHSILDLGCGTGKHDIELDKYGYQIKGIDISENMISIAKSKGSSNSYEVADIREYRDGIKYDACISLFHVLSYQNDNNDIIKTFTTANKELKENGLFIFDCWYGPGVLSDKPAIRVKRVETDQYIFIRNAIPVFHIQENVVDVNYEVLVVEKSSNTVQMLSETHPMRYLFFPELQFFLASTGFELVDCLDCKTLGGLSFDSWTAYFVARKERDI